MKTICDRKDVVPIMKLFAKALRPMMTLGDAARICIWEKLIGRVEHDVDVLGLALRSVDELARVVEQNGIEAPKELAKAKIVLAKH